MYYKFIKLQSKFIQYTCILNLLIISNLSLSLDVDVKCKNA